MTKFRFIAPLFIMLMTMTSSSWATVTQSFYTDDSGYYLKLYKHGFEQRFRVNAADCDQISNAEIVVYDRSANSLNKNFSYPMVKTNYKKNNKENSNWTLPYGVQAESVCWFKGKVSDHSLEHDLLYTLKVRMNGVDYYFNAEMDSLIPYKRFSKNLKQWMSVGALGATVVQDGGTFFKIWEPEAERVDIRINQSQTFSMTPPSTAANTHTLYLENVGVNDQYALYYVKDGEYENLEIGNDELFSSIKVDPMAKNIVYDRKGGSLNAYLNPRAVVTQDQNYAWKHDFTEKYRQSAEFNNWIIYQLWPLTFNPKKVDGKFVGGKFTDIYEKLDYLEGLGITSIEFLPVHESRFHASWGYALDSFTLIEKNYGTPTELRAIIDEFHKRKLKVVFDVVLNHINNSLLREPLTAERQSSKIYGGTTDWGPKPDFDNVMVRKWINDSILNLVRDYHLDGLRFDMVEHIYKGSASGYKFLQELNTLLKAVNPHFYSSAEQLPDNVWATYPVADGGLAFDSQWNDKFKNFFELKFDYYREGNRQIDLSPLVGSLNGYSNQNSGYGEYHFGGAGRTVNYLGSHDVVGNKNPFLRIISDFSSYEQSGHNLIFRVRPLEIANKFERETKFRMIHNHFNHQASMTSYGILFTKPGATLFFQGEELGTDINIENEWSYVNAQDNNSIPSVDVDINRYVGSHRVQWEYLDQNDPILDFLSAEEKQSFKDYHLFFKDLIQFKKNHPEINSSDARDVRYLRDGILSYRIDRGPNEHFVLINYNHDQQDLWVDFPGTSTDWWHESVSLTQSKYNQGKTKFRNIITNLGGRANVVRLAGPSVSIFTKQKHALVQDQLYLRTSLSQWKAEEGQKLMRASDNGELYSTTLTVSQDSEFAFKLGTADWSIDLGVNTELMDSLESLFMGTYEGFLTYNPDQNNATVSLSPGTYQFIFNLRTYKYTFIKL